MKKEEDILKEKGHTNWPVERKRDTLIDLLKYEAFQASIEVKNANFGGLHSLPTVGGRGGGAYSVPQTPS